MWFLASIFNMQANERNIYKSLCMLLIQAIYIFLEKIPVFSFSLSRTHATLHSCRFAWHCFCSSPANIAKPTHKSARVWLGQLPCVRGAVRQPPVGVLHRRGPQWDDGHSIPSAPIPPWPRFAQPDSNVVFVPKIRWEAPRLCQAPNEYAGPFLTTTYFQEFGDHYILKTTPPPPPKKYINSISKRNMVVFKSGLGFSPETVPLPVRGDCHPPLQPLGQSLGWSAQWGTDCTIQMYSQSNCNLL